MLTLEQEKIAGDAIAAVIVPRTRTFRREHSAERIRAKALGASGGSREVVAITLSIIKEYTERAELAWGQMRRILPAKVAPDDKVLVQQLRKVLFMRVDQCSEDLKKLYDEIVIGMHTVAYSFEELKEEAHFRVGAEIAMAVEELKKSHVASEFPSIQIEQFTGNLQLGGKSRAIFNQQIGEHSKGLVAALERLAADLDQGTEMEHVARAELIEIIDDAKLEAGKPAPNLMKLQLWLTGIAATVQTAAALDPAYQLLKTAALHFQVTLP